MKIYSGTIGMESARSYASVSQSQVFARAATIGTEKSAKEGNELGFAGFLSSDEQSEEGAKKVSDKRMDIANRFETDGFDAKKEIERIRRSCLQYLIYWLFGGDMEKLKERMNEMGDGCMSQTPTAQTASAKSVMEVNYSSYYREEETTTFATQGTVITEDGREISFNISATMSRSFEETYASKNMGEIVQMMDPLVINTKGNLTGLSDQTFTFDLDGDGVLENLHRLESGNGYLALDRNGDGRIGDGSELFGTSSGDGFRDLAIYDEDGNGWIDENDEIFSKLIIWSKNDAGEDEMYYLKEAGVGALCLAKAQTEFSLNSQEDNSVYGKVRSTGFFLYEDGGVGTMQQLDLAM
ncbi:MAG: hypothetical protein K6G07_05585 [Lachnospiraceae bacterium]|nr:hypothetical protein [Lachnospiraceae bacterium]